MKLALVDIRQAYIEVQVYSYLYLRSLLVSQVLIRQRIKPYSVELLRDFLNLINVSECTYFSGDNLTALDELKHIADAVSSDGSYVIARSRFGKITRAVDVCGLMFVLHTSSKIKK